MRVKKAEYIEGYKLKLVFSDKKTKLVDLEDLVKKSKGIFLPLKDSEYFKQVAVDEDGITIRWPNGADLCPEILYEMGHDLPVSPKNPIKPRKQRKRTIEKSLKYQTTHALTKARSKKIK